MKGLFAWVGFPTTVLVYAREPRAAGETKWNYAALFGLAFEGVTSFSIVPLRWATALGGACWRAYWARRSAPGFVLKTLLFGDPVHGYPSLMAMVTFLGGDAATEYRGVGRIRGRDLFLRNENKPLYLLRDVIGSPLPSRLRSWGGTGF